MKRIIKRIILIIALIMISVVIIYPFLLIILTSMKTEPEFAKNPIGLPNSINLDNFIYAIKTAHIPDAMVNSIIITVFSLLGQLLFGSLAAYALTKMKFKKSRFFLNFYLFPIVFSIQIVILPVFMIFKYMHLLNTHVGVIMIYVATGLPLAVFILAKFMQNISDSLCEAAYIDGASHFRIYLSVVLPLIKAPLSAICVINGLYVWNDFFVPLMFFTKGDIRTLPLSIFLFLGGDFKKWTLASADILIIILPFIFVYLFLQRFFIRGIAEGALKG